MKQLSHVSLQGPASCTALSQAAAMTPPKSVEAAKAAAGARRICLTTIPKKGCGNIGFSRICLMIFIGVCRSPACTCDPFRFWKRPCQIPSIFSGSQIAFEIF